MTKDQQFLAWNRRGLFPGPDETEENFVKRVALLEELAEDPILFFEKRDIAPPLKAIASFENRVARNDIDWVLAKLSRSYEILPSWLLSLYSNEDLFFWQGAACWIIEIEGIALPLVQLKSKLKGGSYLKIYKRDEILVHEAIHAVRMTFDEPKFEEFLAYLASSSSFRRAFGPLFSSSKDPILLFFPLMIGGLLLPFFPKIALIAYLSGLSWLAIKLFILLRRHTVLRRASNQLLKLIQDPKKVRALLLRLTDEEIYSFSSIGSEGAKSYIQKAKELSLRWKIIYKSYFV